MEVLIIPFYQSFDDKGLTYIVPDFLEKEVSIGDIIEIPLGDNLVFGIISKISKNHSKIEGLKPIIAIKQKGVLLNYQLELLNFLSIRYFSLAHNSLSLFLSTHLKNTIIKDKYLVSKRQKINLEYTYNNNFKLTSSQLNTFSKILDSNNYKFLLHGVTGSGKTQVYINLIKHFLDKGQQSLLLVPEIILTNQIAEKIKYIFGEDVLIINSTVTDTKKSNYHHLIKQNKAKIVVGTRSALFYPFSDLGVVIIDEEHDNSYLSDQTPRYDAVEVAIKLTDLMKTKLILGSGTPKINHMYLAMKGDLEVLNMFSEFT